MAMIETADIVAKRYGISREDQDASPQPASARPPRPRPPVATGRDHRLHHHHAVKNKATGEVTYAR
jgi:acetyl-CoA C-acetyltransferase